MTAKDAIGRIFEEAAWGRVGTKIESQYLMEQPHRAFVFQSQMSHHRHANYFIKLVLPFTLRVFSVL